MKNFSFLKTPKNLTIFFDGKLFTIQAGDVKYQTILELIRTKDHDEIERVLSPGSRVISYGQGHLTLVNDELFFTGEKEPIHSSITKKILDFLNENLPIEPLVAFGRNLRENPSKRSVEQLYNFLEKNHHPLTEDGCFLAYKKVTSVNGELMDSHTKTFNNNIGRIVTMPREEVNENPNQTCSSGLHVASFEYANNFSGNTLIIVKVNPRDVVSVPVDYNSQKMRCCQYEVLSLHLDSEIKKHLVNTSKTTKETKSKEKVAPLTNANGKKVILSTLTAREIVATVKTILKIKMKDNLKNKQSILKKATNFLNNAGYQVC